MEGHLRMSFCGAINELAEGVTRIQWALDPNAPSELYMGGHKLVRDWQ
jgi:aspartate aminotransferase